MMDMTISQLNLIVNGLEDRVTFSEKKIKRLSDENHELCKKVEMLLSQFDLQGARVVQPRLYRDIMKKPSEVLIHAVNLHDFESKFDETMWKMLEIISATGAARYPDIERLVRMQIPDFVENRLRRAAKALTEMNVLNRKELKLPLTPRTTLYSLAEIGERLYREKFKVAPVPSEMVKIVREHDNLEHGYGILELAQLLANSRKYKDVYAFNRTQPVKFSDGTQYIPDVMCRNLDGKTKTYFEYERGNHTQKNFNAKCDKICFATTVLNFVAPNREDLARKLYPLMKEWVRKKGVFDISSTVVRLTTSKELQTCYLSDESWLIIFDLSKSIEPIICNIDPSKY